MGYKEEAPEKFLHIENVHSIYYRELAQGFNFSGESHDFWEVVYVDSGEINVVAGMKVIEMLAGQVVFHKPNEFHSLACVTDVAPCIIIFSFTSKSETMRFFEDKVFRLSADQKTLLGRLLAEARMCLTDLGIEHNLSASAALPGAKQLCLQTIEHLLINLYRTNYQTESSSERAMNVGINALVADIIEFMKQNVSKKLTMSHISDRFFISDSKLKYIFKNITGQSVMHFFFQLKMNEAKFLIRQKRHNFTEIARILGFDSIHYFSACFRRHFGMTPSEYKTSVKSITEGLEGAEL